MKQEKVIVLGASPKAERYSNKAVHELAAAGHWVFPVHPRCAEIHGQKCYPALEAVPQPVDTITLYIGEERSKLLEDKILSLKPRRIIMNPGAENHELENKAQAQNIEVVRGCTLVMLRTQQF